MKNLFKYEFRKTLLTKLIILGITIVAQAVYLFGIWSKDRETTVVVGMLLLFFTAMFGIVFIGLQSVLTLHRDMNTKQSYMLFMTPHSCYSILGAKTLECCLSILLTGVCFFALGALDVSLLFAREGKLVDLWDFIHDLLANITINGHSLEIDPATLAAVVFVLLAAWILTIITAFLAVTISAALLNGRRFSGVISFVLFLALSLGCSLLTNLVTRPIPGNITVMMVHGLLSLVFAAVMYFVTAKIMEDKLSV